MIKCFNCGEENPDESRYCLKCGNQLKLNINNDDNNQNQQSIPNQNQQPIPNQNQQPIPNQNYNNQQYPQNNQNFNNQSGNPNFNNQPKKSLTEKFSDLSTPVKVISILAICCIGVLIVGAIIGSTSDQGSLPSNSNYSGSSSSSSGSSIASNFNKSDCKEISYNELSKNPDKYIGDNLKLSGKVFQISEGDSSGNFLLMYVGGEYEFDQVLYVEYQNDTNIVKDDWITVYGVCEGSYSYSTRIGGSNTVPSLYAVDLQKG